MVLWCVIKLLVTVINELFDNERQDGGADRTLHDFVYR